MNMSGTPSGYSQMGTPPSVSQMSSSMGNMTPSRTDGRSPHFVRSTTSAPGGNQIVTAPDVSKLGEDLALRASAADTELKRRLKAEQHGVISSSSNEPGVYACVRGRYSPALPLKRRVARTTVSLSIPVLQVDQRLRCDL